MEHDKEKKKKYHKEYYESHKEDWKKAMLKRYGWTPESVEAARVAQNNTCAICKKVFSQQRGHWLCPDHKHGQPPKPRRLLCNTCNTAIGLLMDSPGLCEAAAEYLRAWGE